MSLRLVLAMGLVVFGAVACSSSSGGSSSSSSGSSGTSGSSGSSGTSGTGGTSGSSGSSGGTVAALPATTFVFNRRVAAGADSLVAYDLATKSERVITDLRGDGSSGWSITGFGISPDRTRIVLAAPYNATAADVATLLATPILWTLDVMGGDFQRLTPTFKNNHADTPGWRIDVRSPSYSKDGASVLYNYGEGASGGYTEPWSVSAAGGALPTRFPVTGMCSNLTDPSVNPATGEVLVTQNVCSSSADNGLFLYPANGGTPKRLIGEAPLSFGLETPRWSADGSLFVFSASDSGQIRSLYAYSMTEQKVVQLVPGTADRRIWNGAVSADGNALVYCVHEGEAANLHVVDVSVDPPTDTAITNDGASCDPVFF